MNVESITGQSFCSRGTAKRMSTNSNGPRRVEVKVPDACFISVKIKNTSFTALSVYSMQRSKVEQDSLRL